MNTNQDKFNEDFMECLDYAFDKINQSEHKFHIFTKEVIHSMFNNPSKQTSDKNKGRKIPATNFTELSYWLPILKHPLVIVILGGRGRGKSALGYKIAEYLKEKADVYVVGLPERAKRLLPEWIGSVPSIEDVPPNASVIFDES